MTRDFKFETLQLHAGQVVDPATKSRAVPICQTTSFVFDDTQEGADLFALENQGISNTHYYQPTKAFERIAALEGWCWSTSDSIRDGCCNLHYFGACSQVTMVAASIFGGTFNLLKETLPRYRITTTFVDVDNLEEVNKLIQ